MNDELIILFSRMILDSEGGQLYLVFLLAYSFTTDEVPTLENTKQLTKKSAAFKKAGKSGTLLRL